MEDGVKAGLGEGDHFASLANMAQGAVVESFNEELKRVLRNIGDVNTSAQATREITIKVKIKPDEERRIAGVTAAVASKLAPVKPVATAFFLGRHKNDFVAVESDPQQRGLFENKPDIQPIEKGA